MSNKTSRKAKVLFVIGAVIVILLLTALYLISPRSAALGGPEGAQEGVWNGVSAADWMGNIDGELTLSEISIPGSHDTCTQFVLLPLVGRCQSESVLSQLEAGVRALDIRIDSSGDTLTLSHGPLACKAAPHLLSNDLTFEIVLDECFAFLDAHPTESVIMLIKQERGEDTAADLQARIDAVIGDSSDYLYAENRMPTLDEARGKIVLARRYGEQGDESLPGLPFCWADQGGSTPSAEAWESLYVNDSLTLCVQDRYEYETPAKWNTVTFCLEHSPADSETFFLNYLSTKGESALGFPESFASSINSRFIAHELRSGTNYGCVMFDFVNEALCRHVFASNNYR